MCSIVEHINGIIDTCILICSYGTVTGIKDDIQYLIDFNKRLIIIANTTNDDKEMNLCGFNKGFKLTCSGIMYLECDSSLVRVSLGRDIVIKRGGTYSIMSVKGLVCHVTVDAETDKSVFIRAYNGSDVIINNEYSVDEACIVRVKDGVVKYNT